MNEKRAARAIQAECGASYCAALDFVRRNGERIVSLITRDGKPDWREQAAAAVGLWRREKGDR